MGSSHCRYFQCLSVPDMAARAYIRPLAEHQVPRLPRKSHRQSSGDQGTPERTSDPLQSTKCCACHAKATGRGAETKGRQGVRPTPCGAPSAAPATQKPPAEQRRPRDAKAYTSDPLQSTKCRACHAKASGDQGTPGRTSDPLQSTKCCACHAKASGRAPETKGRQGVHPTPCGAPSAAPATQKSPAEQRRPRDARRTSAPCRAPSAAPATQKPPAEERRPRDARAYIRPLAEHQVLRLPRKSHRRPRDAKAYIRPLAEHQMPRLPRKSQRRPRDARAYIGLLAKHQVLRLPRKSQRQSTGDQGTPGRTSDPLQSTKCCACHAKATGRAAETKGRKGLHPTHR